MKYSCATHFMSACMVWLCSSSLALGQQATSPNMPLSDLSSFKNPGKSWSIVSDVTADLDKPNVLNTVKGAGILVNEVSKRIKGTDLFTTAEHGDTDLELDYMMAKGSNSGIYLQGRYEFQLEDTWGTKNPTAGSNGGIYERWDDSKPEGQKGYQGYAPRQNASKAPGLWQHLKISFQAPRFDAAGKKIENAKILLAELNGVIIHENVELLGPTRGAMSNDEKATGPLRIQGDHGAVAFRNIKMVNFGKPRPELVNLKYAVYKGKFEKETDFSKLPPEAEGTSVILTSKVSKIPNEFFIRYTGTLRVKEPGEYQFNFASSGGGGLVKINNQVVSGQGQKNMSINLPAGDVPFELLYSKLVDWEQPALGLAVTGPGIREYLISDDNPGGNNMVDPILLHADVNTTLRSFMDMPNGPRIVHAISVGSPQQVHYTYDMDRGMIVQVWRGGFLDATPMWHERGDGSSRPVGALQNFGKPAMIMAKLASADATWIADSVTTSLRPKGYKLDAQDRPIFQYLVNGVMVTDASKVMDNGQGISRELTVQNPAEGMYARLAEAATIQEISNNTYLVDGKSYYLRLDDNGGAKPVIRDANGRKELIIPVRNKLSYSILF